MWVVWSYETTAPTDCPPADVRVNDALVIVDALIDFGNVAVTSVARATYVLPADGVVAVTVGAVGGCPAVVNDQVTGAASAVTSADWMDAASVAVYVEVVARPALGVNVAVSVESSYETVAGTAEPLAFFRVNDDGVIDAGSIERENVAWTAV